MTFLLIAGYPDSLLNFRGPLLDALLARGLAVHVAAPDPEGMGEGALTMSGLKASGVLEVVKVVTSQHEPGNNSHRSGL